MSPRVLTAVLLSAVACGGHATPTADAPPVVRISFLPDDNIAALEQIADRLAAYLRASCGLDVRYQRAADYQACVQGLASDRLDLVWLGGVTFCQAHARTGAAVEVVACRDIDLQFKSYLIANHALVESGAVRPLSQLADLKPLLAGRTLSFGAKDSTSGHVMPRHFLLQAGIAPERDLEGGPRYQLLGGHAATFRAVSSGQVDFGFLNYAVYDKQPEAERRKAPVLFTTEPYVDYCFVAHRRLGQATVDRLRQALLALDAQNPDHAPLLAAWKCTRFVAADQSRWDGMRKVLAELPKDFLK